MFGIDVLILVLAAVLRLAHLDIKPPHFDEGVNGWFVDTMTEHGYYRYDPTNFHGPFHFYVLFVAQTLLGRSVAALRTPLVLVSIACVFMALAFRRHIGKAAARFAALAMAVSPAMVFYGRYAIHETWLVFFLMLGMWGIAELWRYGSRAGLWAFVLSISGMILTKETYIIHIASLALAVPTLLILESLSRSEALPFARSRWRESDLHASIAVATLALIFFYTAGFMDPGGLTGLVETFKSWLPRGIGTGDDLTAKGHEKPWSYWLLLLGGIHPDAPNFSAMSVSNEWPGLIGLLSVLGVLAPQSNRFVRYLAIYGTGAFVAYSIVSYKTPWCLIAMLWPFHLLFGVAVARAMVRLDRWVVGVAAVLFCAQNLAASWQLNFRHYADETEPYVYVQTRVDIREVTRPLEWLVARDPANRHVPGFVVTQSHHPMLWLLADYSGIQFVHHDADTLPAHGAMLLVDESLAEDIEAHLAEPYFRRQLQIRGNSAELEVLYLHAPTFQAYFGDRVPEFQPRPAEPEPFPDLP